MWCDLRFCLQNGFLQPTKRYGHKLDYKMAFSSLQNGMATNSTTKWLSPAYKMVWPRARPYKMVFLVNYLGPFLSTTILICSSKNGRTFAFMLITEWFVLVPANYDDVFNKKWQSLLKPTVYYKMASPDPIFSTEWKLLRVSTPPILWRKWQGGWL